jgi:outer membrane lipoprotein SlyB
LQLINSTNHIVASCLQDDAPRPTRQLNVAPTSGFRQQRKLAGAYSESMAEQSQQVKDAGRSGALTYGSSGAALGASIGTGVGGPIGTAVGAGVGFTIGALIGFGVERKAAKNLESDQERIAEQQERLAKEAARQQQQLAREAAGQAQKKGSTKVPPPPSNIMLEAVGTGSDFDAWHSRTF